MDKIVLKPYNVIDNTGLPEVEVDRILTDGDPVEIDGELYFICKVSHKKKSDCPEIGLIPLVVRNPAKVQNIKEYIKCLTIAHRRVRFKNKHGSCDLDNCDEMVIS